MSYSDRADFATHSNEGHAFSRQEKMRRLRRMRTIARFMDTAIRIPGTEIRFGADALLGLLPGIGDAGGAAIGVAIINEARKLGVPKRKLAKMLGNLATDTVFGSVPIVGDIFDVAFKAHRRNVQLVLDHFDLEMAEIESESRPMKDVTPGR